MTRTSDRAGVPLWRVGLWGGIAALLVLPLIAMQFTSEVAWTATDFLFAAILLVGAGALFELAAWKVRDLTGRLVLAAVLIGAVLLVWADGAVGIF
ncbi:hypothetical protein [Brevundimonas sp. M20]|uniref:hypothetical protein n=1 Tax=Brevundimonas sp. M20 TaxID=2591463 RepID=UPI001F117F77|nr:hypothetical protein [Brevundimonas sp. M20]